METKVTKSNNFERLIEVSVPENELTPHFNSALEKYRKNLRLEGFRKGKVPMHLVKKLYGDAIKGQALDDVIQSVFQEVKQKEKLRPIAPAQLDDIDYQPESGLKFKAKVEVVPDIQLKKYKGLSAEKEVYQVDEKDIENAIEELREKNAVMEPVEDEAKQDHYILADLQQVDAGGIPLIGKKYEDRWVHLNDDESNDFTPQLLGVKAGETRRVELEPVEPQAEQNGKDYFDVLVKEVKLKRVPEIDDELAKDVGDFQTLEDLKKDIREKLEAQSENISKRNLKQKLIDALLKKNDFDLPETMIKNYLEVMVENARHQSAQQQQQQPFDEEAFKNQYRQVASRTIKWELSKGKLVEIESIAVDEADRERFVEQMAKERNVDVKEIKKTLRNKDTAKRVDDDLLEEKVLAYLETNAKIKEKKITRKDIEKLKK